jgi:hypothetical protein
MRNRFSAFFVIVAAAAILSSCATTQYLGPSDFVSFRADEKLRTSTQSSALKQGENQALVNTYDQELVYDGKGNVIKVKLTEYIDVLAKDKKFIVWETDYKVIGGNLVPGSMSANGVPFLEAEYELLTGAGKGEVVADIMERPVSLIYKDDPLARPIYIDLNVALSNYTVSFAPDGHFVREIRGYKSNGDYFSQRTLTLGWDNIVLKRFHYSQEKLSEGIGKSYTGYNRNSEMFKKMSKDSNIDYSYEWTVIGGVICQTKMQYEAKRLKLEAKIEFNAEGKRTKETWFLSDPSNKKSVPQQVFAQELAY